MPRILGIDIPANKRIDIALRSVYGIGPTISAEVLANTKIDPATVNRGDKATVLPAAYRDAFQRARRYREGLLDNSRRGPAQVVADAAQR